MAIESNDTRIPPWASVSDISEYLRKIDKDLPNSIPPAPINDPNKLIVDPNFSDYVEPFKSGKIPPEQMRKIVNAEYSKFRKKLINLEDSLNRIKAELLNKNRLQLTDSDSSEINLQDYLTKIDSKTVEGIDETLQITKAFKTFTRSIELEHKDKNKKFNDDELSQVFADLRWMERTTQLSLKKIGFINTQIIDGEAIQGENFSNQEITTNVEFKPQNLVHPDFNIYVDKTFEGKNEDKKKLVQAFNSFLETKTGKALLKKLKEVNKTGTSKISISVGDSSFASEAVNGLEKKDGLEFGWIRFGSKSLKQNSLDEVTSIWANELFDQFGFLKSSEDKTLGYLVATPQYQLLGMLYDASVKEEVIAKTENRPPKPVDIKTYIFNSPYYGLLAPFGIGRYFDFEQIQKLDELTDLATRGEYKTFKDLLRVVNPNMNNTLN